MKKNNIYINIVRGLDIEMSDSKFAESYIDFERFKGDFFRDRDITISDVQQLGENTEFTFELNFVKFHAVFVNIKNSGMGTSENDKVRKRMQVGSNIKHYDDNVPHFYIGAYNTYDKIIYVIVELKDYIGNKKAKNQTAYSSFWIDYSHLSFTYERGFNRYIDSKNNRVIVGIDNLKINEFEDEELIEKLFLSKEYYKNEYNKIADLKDKTLFVLSENTVTMYDAGFKLKRNQDLKRIAFERENHTCELCGTRTTFLNKNGEEYFEGHHLIMYNYSSQKKYKYNLDNSENIICLCPTCHRKIHYSSPEDIREIVEKLFQKHFELYSLYDISNLEEVLYNYVNYEGDDEDE